MADYKKTLKDIAKVVNYGLTVALGNELNPNDKFMNDFMDVYKSFAKGKEVVKQQKVFNKYKRNLNSKQNVSKTKREFNDSFNDLTRKMFNTIGFTEGKEGILNTEPFKSQMGTIANFLLPKMVKQINKLGKKPNKEQNERIENVMGTMITSFKKYPNVNDNEIGSSLGGLKEDRKINLKKLDVEVFSEATRQEVLKKASQIKTEEGFDVAIKVANTRAEKKILEDAKRDYMSTDEFKEKQKATLAAKAEKMNTLINRKAQVRLKMKDFNYSNLTTAAEKQAFLDEALTLPIDKQTSSMIEYVLRDVMATEEQEKATAEQTAATTRAAQVATNLATAQENLAQTLKDDQDKLDGAEEIKTMDKALLDEKLAELEGKENLTVKETAMVQPLKDRIEGEKAKKIQAEDNLRLAQEQAEQAAKEERRLAQVEGDNLVSLLEPSLDQQSEFAGTVREEQEGLEEANRQYQQSIRPSKLRIFGKTQKFLYGKERMDILREQNEAEEAYRQQSQTEFFDSYIDQMGDTRRAQSLRNAIIKFAAIKDDGDSKHRKNRVNGLLRKFANPRFSAEDRQVAGDLATALFVHKDKELLTTGGAKPNVGRMEKKLEKLRNNLEKTGMKLRTEAREEGKDIKGFLNRPTKDAELTNPQTPRQELRQGREIALAGRAMNQAVGGGGVAGESEGDRQARVRAERLTESQYDSGGPRVGRGNQGIISQADMDREYPRRVRPALGTTARQAETAKTVQRTAEYKRQWGAMGTTIRSMNLNERVIGQIEGTGGLEGEQQRSVRQSAINYRDTRRYIEENQDLINKDWADMAVNNGQLVGTGGDFGGYFFDAENEFAKGDYATQLAADVAAGKNVVQVYSNGMNLVDMGTTDALESGYYAGSQYGPYLGEIASIVRAEQVDKTVYYAHTQGGNYVEGIGLDRYNPNIDTQAIKRGNLKISDLQDPFPSGGEGYKSGSIFGRVDINLPKLNVVSIKDMNLKRTFLDPNFDGVLLHTSAKTGSADLRQSGYVGTESRLFKPPKKSIGQKSAIEVAPSVREGEIASSRLLTSAKQEELAKRGQRKKLTKYLYGFQRKRPIATLRPFDK